MASFHKLCFANFQFWQSWYSANVPASCLLWRQILWVGCFGMGFFFKSCVFVKKIHFVFGIFLLGKLLFVCLRDVSFIFIFHCAALSLWRQNLSARPPETPQFVISGHRWITPATTWDRKEHTTEVAGKYPNNKSAQWKFQIDNSQRPKKKKAEREGEKK